MTASLEEVGSRKQGLFGGSRLLEVSPGKLYLVTSPFLFLFLLLPWGHEVSSL